jgi:hypothetical protein
MNAPVIKKAMMAIWRTFLRGLLFILALVTVIGIFFLFSEYAGLWVKISTAFVFACLFIGALLDPDNHCGY